jgi:hypothetical protein
MEGDEERECVCMYLRGRGKESWKVMKRESVCVCVVWVFVHTTKSYDLNPRRTEFRPALIRSTWDVFPPFLRNGRRRVCSTCDLVRKSDQFDVALARKFATSHSMHHLNSNAPVTKIRH